MKLSEILKDWPEKSSHASVSEYYSGYNAALIDCDREIDREALAKKLYKIDWPNDEFEHDGDCIKESQPCIACHCIKQADVIISTMPTWLKRIEK